MSTVLQHSIEILIQRLLPETAVRWTSDEKKNLYGWVELEHAASLATVAKELLTVQGRLMTITAHAPEEHSEKGFFEVCYHFDVKGTALTLRVVPEGATPTVPSITPWHKAADWAEREIHELYQIEVAGHPNPEPLFLSNITQPLAMEKLVPLSTMSNGACTNVLWEQIMGEKAEKN